MTVALERRLANFRAHDTARNQAAQPRAGRAESIGAERLAAEVDGELRSHWSIENAVHRVRDVSFGEDACTVTSGNAPQAWAALRNAAIALLRRNGVVNIAQALRSFAVEPVAALKLLGASIKDY